MPTGKSISKQEINEIHNFYLSRPMTLDTVSKKFGLSKPTISKILSDVPKYSKAKINNPQMDEHFFKIIDTEEKAYFLGLLITDGNIFKENEISTSNRQASISITLDLKDEYMLNNFKQAVKSNTSVSHDGRGCGQIAIRSNIMAQELEQYGITPRKTFTTYLPLNIPNNLMRHVIRGILDGDGSIQAKQNPNNTKFLHSISFCGTHKLMEDISFYIDKELKLNFKPNVYDYKDRSLSDLKIQNKEDMYKFGEWIYKDAKIYLVRKKEIYDNFKNHYNLS